MLVYAKIILVYANIFKAVKWLFIVSSENGKTPHKVLCMCVRMYICMKFLLKTGICLEKYIYIYVCVCVCVCVRERERERV